MLLGQEPVLILTSTQYVKEEGKEEIGEEGEEEGGKEGRGERGRES